ncbi:MAG: hypothetical protein KDA28_07790, partial [Phycisphaerales bacterium]|nr:hypothetical protein [Phycisphaerales bacterium]
RSPVEGVVRAFCCDAAGIAFAEDLDDHAAFLERVRAHVPRPCPFDEATVDLVGMIAFHLFDANGTSIHVTNLDAKALQKACRTCLGLDDDLVEHEAES